MVKNHIVKHMVNHMVKQYGRPGLRNPLEKGVATHSSILAWRIPWTEEPGGLQFVGLQRVGLD